MSTPTVERPGAARGQATRRAARDGAADPARGAARGAVGRAYAKRAGRRERLGGLDAEHPQGRSQFVLSVMALLGIGLVASLWLSTTAAADSYRLNAARQATTDLSERIEIVQSRIDAMQSPPAIAKAAASLGMVQVSDVARLIVGQDGKVSVFGTPKAAVGAPVPTANPPKAPVAQQAPDAAQQPVSQAPAAQPPVGQAPAGQAPAGQAPADQAPAWGPAATLDQAAAPGQAVAPAQAPSSAQAGPATGAGH